MDDERGGGAWNFTAISPEIEGVKMAEYFENINHFFAAHLIQIRSMYVVYCTDISVCVYTYIYVYILDDLQFFFKIISP